MMMPTVYVHARVGIHVGGSASLHASDTRAVDPNAIEACWPRPRQRLDETAPVNCESRPAFLKRLRRAVRWMNLKRRVEGRKLCRNQKVRASRALALKGAKCEW